MHMGHDGAGKMRSLLCLAGAALLVSLAIFIYAEPVMDGDLWFHLAYGRYMVEHGTLVPDHTIYSWTPTDNNTIYCAWIPEIVLYAIHAWSGLAGLFALRYAFLLVFFAFVFNAMARGGSFSSPVAWVVALMGVMSVQVAMQIKPEILSFVFMAVTAWAWVMIRLSRGHGWMYCHLIPAVMLLWVNSHGGFVFGLFFLALLAVGEALNIMFGLNSRLEKKAARHFFTAVVLSAAATLVTPYWGAYPMQLFRELVLNQSDQLQEFRAVMAYQTILHPSVRGLHLLEYMAASAAILAGLMWGEARRGRWNWSIALAALGMGALSTQFMRTTYFWGVFSVFACLLVLGRRERAGEVSRPALRKYSGLFCIALCVIVSGREACHTLCKPLAGFWVNYYSPMEEAEYIRANLKGCRLGNNYNSGAYLLWSLWPGQKVFIDARYFPYRRWYRDYRYSMYGKDDRARDAFLARYGPEVWCTTYEYDHLSYFIRSPAWLLVHYGPSACIFVRRDIGFKPAEDRCSPEVFAVRPHQKLRILDFMLLVGDLDEAFRMVQTFKMDRLCPVRNIQASSGCVKAGDALAGAGRVDDAIVCVERAVAIRPGQGPEVLTLMGNLHLKKGDPGKALEFYGKALDIRPDYAPAIGNSAKAYSLLGDFRKALGCLHRLLEIQPDNPNVEYDIACLYARQNRVDDAVRSLRNAVSKGFDKMELLRTDPDLAGLRHTGYYRDLVK